MKEPALFSPFHRWGKLLAQGKSRDLSPASRLQCLSTRQGTWLTFWDPDLWELQDQAARRACLAHAGTWGEPEPWLLCRLHSLASMSPGCFSYKVDRCPERTKKGVEKSWVWPHAPCTEESQSWWLRALVSVRPGFEPLPSWSFRQLFHFSGPHFAELKSEASIKGLKS